jgi:hypothetical protein
MAPPTTSAAAIQPIPPALTRGPSIVASTAIAMPIMPYRLPRRELSGFDRPPRLKMKRMVAPIYATDVRLPDIIVLRYLRNIDSMRRVTAKPPNMLTAVSAMPTTASQRMMSSGRTSPAHHGVDRRRRDLHQRTDDDDAADRIGDAHQRRVQGRRHVPHDHVADEAGQHEHREVAEESRRRKQAQSAQRAPPRRQNGRGHPGDIGSAAMRRDLSSRSALTTGLALPQRPQAGAADSFGTGGGHVNSPSLTTVVPRMTSSSMLTTKIPSLALHSSSERRKDSWRTGCSPGSEAGSADRCSR